MMQEEAGELLTLKLWRTPAMAWMMTGNLAFALYYVLMSLVTDEVLPHRLTNLQFMAVTNLVAVGGFSIYVLASRPLRRQFAAAFGLPRWIRGCGCSGGVGGGGSVTARALSMLAECSNYLAMLAISFAFDWFPSNEGVVAAARASLNQFTNCALGASMNSD